jgi:putative cardiolipin synthase
MRADWNRTYMRYLLLLAFLIGAVLGLGLLLRLLNPLPPLGGRTDKPAPGDLETTRLGRALAAVAAANAGLAGILALSNARDSFGARVGLVRAAERCLDLQYYIWQLDTSGRLLLEEVARAAARGVKVRLLLDDNGTTGLDDALAALDAHPDVEVRLWNPFTIRRPKALGYLMDFFRLNRRMHNKSLTADRQATILGGRNVGDEYFGASADSLFADLDMLVVGEIVGEVAADFDRYWASASAYPVDRILPPVPFERFAALVAEPEPESGLAREYGAVVAAGLAERWIEGPETAFEWVPATLVSDDPCKGLRVTRGESLLLGQLIHELEAPEHSLGLVSAYFVPTDAGRDALIGLAKRGVKVSVLTNALSSTDVATVHAGYAKHRKALLKAGVRLWELKGTGRAELSLTVLGSRGSARPVFRSSGSSLHAKTFAVDRRRIFVGSFNFDPRSAELNTELGLLADSCKLAGALQDVLETRLGDAAYEVRLATNGRVEWVEQVDGRPFIHEKEPQTSLLRRALVTVVSRLPIDWML